ncbi:uroporphyrinogen-III methylase [Actinobacillus equuli]|nr:uroporphyrinogen-III methylase [Actinobacillus equuli]
MIGEVVKLQKDLAWFGKEAVQFVSTQETLWQKQTLQIKKHTGNKQRNGRNTMSFLRPNLWQIPTPSEADFANLSQKRPLYINVFNRLANSIVMQNSPAAWQWKIC